MDQALLEFFGPREEPLKLGGREVVVKSLPEKADVSAFKTGDPQDFLWKFVVRCTFYADGTPAFTDDDIPVLKAAPRLRTLRLVQLVQDVNAFDTFAEVKNSGGVPSSA